MNETDNQIMHLQQAIERKDAEIARLRGVIKKYGQHIPMCASLEINNCGCNCGFDKALTGGAE